MGLYQNCRELPIHNFFEISRTNDFSYLVKSGRKPKEEVLRDKYLEIVDEYNSLFSNKTKNPAMVSQSKFIAQSLKVMNLELLEIIIKTSGVTQEVRDVSRKLKIKPEKLSEFILGLKNELSRIELELQNRDSEKDNESDIHALEKSLTLVKENGFNFDRFSTPIIEFVFAINRLEEKQRHYEKTISK